MKLLVPGARPVDRLRILAVGDGHLGSAPLAPLRLGGGRSGALPFPAGGSREVAGLPGGCRFADREFHGIFEWRFVCLSVYVSVCLGWVCLQELLDQRTHVWEDGSELIAACVFPFVVQRLWPKTREHYLCSVDGLGTTLRLMVLLRVWLRVWGWGLFGEGSVKFWRVME